MITGEDVTDITKIDLPKIDTGMLIVTINKIGTAKLGELIIGNKAYLGEMIDTPQIEIVNYSQMTQDAFGDWSIIPRDYSKKLTCNLRIQNTNIDSVFKKAVLYKDSMVVWVGLVKYGSMINYGLYRNFSIVLQNNRYSICALEILSII